MDPAKTPARFELSQEVRRRLAGSGDIEDHNIGLDFRRVEPNALRHQLRVDMVVGKCLERPLARPIPPQPGCQPVASPRPAACGKGAPRPSSRHHPRASSRPGHPSPSTGRTSRYPFLRLSARRSRRMRPRVEQAGPVHVDLEAALMAHDHRWSRCLQSDITSLRPCCADARC